MARPTDHQKNEYKKIRVDEFIEIIDELIKRHESCIFGLKDIRTHVSSMGKQMSLEKLDVYEYIIGRLK